MYFCLISIIVDACVAKKKNCSGGRGEEAGRGGEEAERTWGGVSAQSLQETESCAVCGCHKRVWLRGGACEEREKILVFKAGSLDCDAA